MQFFVICLYFTLQSGIEHGQLLLNPCQIELIENEGERVYLQYTEDLSKNRTRQL